jgi:hypothetical protein
VNSATTALLILALIAAALVSTAFYALFGKPSSSLGKKRQQEMINGFWIAGGILLGFVLMGSLVAFVGIAFGAASTSLHVSRVFAGVIAVSALGVIGLMVQRWAKYFVGWIAWGFLNSLIMAGSGHLLNNPTIPVKHSLALTMAALCFATVLVTRHFTEAYQLDLTEKLALMAWIVGFALAANVETFSIPALAAGTFALAIAWWLHRSKSRRRSSRNLQRQETTSGRPNS